MEISFAIKQKNELNTPACRDIIYYVRTFCKKRISMKFRHLNALSERADIINYAHTVATLIDMP